MTSELNVSPGGLSTRFLCWEPTAIPACDQRPERRKLRSAQHWRAAAFSSPSLVVLVTMFHFTLVTIFEALVERFALLDFANSLQDIGYLFGLNNDCLALFLSGPSNLGQFCLRKPFANVALSEACFPLFGSVRCP